MHLNQVSSKKCSTCQIYKPFKEFWKASATKDGYQYKCKSCHRKMAKPSNTLERTKSVLKARWKRLGIDLTYDEVLAKFEEQNYCCSICKINIDLKFYHYDHDHSTVKLRDILCPDCNKGLGHFGDDPTLLRKAADYIERHHSL